MTSAWCSTRRPFTVAVCMSCAAEPAAQLLQLLRAVVRRCPYGMLVTTKCPLGQLTCATRQSHHGVMLVLQPCSTDRVPTAPAQWVGPVNDAEDARTVREWLERGTWQRHGLPAPLRAEATLAGPSIRN